MRAYAVRVVAVLGLALLGVTGGAAPRAVASSCVQQDPAAVAREADVVVTGRLTEVGEAAADRNPVPVLWTIEVLGVHRGQAPRTLYVEASGNTLADPGSRYVIPLRQVGDRLVVNDCAVYPFGTTEAEATIATAGAARAPAVADSLLGSTPPDIPGTGPWWSSPLGLVAVAVGGLLVLVVGGLVVALLTGLAVGGRRRARPSDRASGRRDSAGTPFK